MDTLDIALRLGVAAFAGAAIGLNRDLQGKPTGVRTLGIVGVGSAMAVLALGHGSTADVSRVIQGLVTGIGFLGAGVIIRTGSVQDIHGLTTAACVWLTACVGAACGVSEWPVLLLAAPIIFIILTLGGPFEKWVHRHWSGATDEKDQPGGPEFKN